MNHKINKIFVHFLNSKLINLGAESSPFDRYQYRTMNQKKKQKDEESVMRWRYSKGKKQKDEENRETNAKIVEWKDGSMHLFIGNKIVFQLDRKPLTRGLNDLFCIPYSAKTAYVCDGNLKEKIMIKKLGSTFTTKKKTRSMKLQENLEDPEYLKRQKEKEYLERKKRKSKASKPRTSRKQKNSPIHYEEDNEEEEDDIFEDDQIGTHPKRRSIDEESIYSAKSNPTQMNVTYKKRKVKDYDDDNENDDIEVFEDDSPIREKDGDGDGDGDLVIEDEDDDDY